MTTAENIKTALCTFLSAQIAALNPQPARVPVVLTDYSDDLATQKALPAVACPMPTLEGDEPFSGWRRRTYKCDLLLLEALGVRQSTADTGRANIDALAVLVSDLLNLGGWRPDAGYVLDGCAVYEMGDAEEIGNNVVARVLSVSVPSIE